MVLSSSRHMPTIFFPWKPNARGEPRPEAEAKRTLEGVGWTRLILIEAPSSAYPDGMLRGGK